MGGEKAAFGERLRGLRETAGLSRDELASRSGLSTKAIGALERGERRRPHPHTFGALTNALGLSDEAREVHFATFPGRSAAAPEAYPSGNASPLPPAPTPLVGRSREVGAAKELLLDHDRAEAYLRESLLLSVRHSGEEYFVAQALEVLATIAAGRGDHLKAARLYRAAEARREAMGSSILPYDAAERERGVAAAREALGEDGFAAAWAEGRAMTPEQNIHEAVGQDAPQ